MIQSYDHTYGYCVYICNSQYFIFKNTKFWAEKQN